MTGLSALGGSGAEVSCDALGGRIIIESVPPGAAVLGIFGCAGRSHDVSEDTRAADIIAGVRVMARAVDRLLGTA